jgi:PAS domain S-box-containing protein
MAQTEENLDQNVEKKILENMTEGVVWTSKGDVVYMNDSARRLMGLQPSDTGKKFAEVFVSRKENDDFVQSVIDSLSQETGTAHVTESDFVTEDGKQMRFPSCQYQHEG